MKSFSEIGKVSKAGEGKTKIVFNCKSTPHTVYLLFKDDITAGDGEKHEVMEGKAQIDWRTNNNIFALLNNRGVPTHFIEPVAEQPGFLAKKLKYKFPLEVVARRMAYGSVLKRKPSIQKGQHFKELVIEFFYKDDFLHDPKLDDEFIAKKDPDGYFVQMAKITIQVFIVLEHAFQLSGHQLIDLKIEFGITEDGQITVIDEITAGSFRLWPIAVPLEKYDLSQDNLLPQLDEEGMLDKERFRKGKDLGTVKSGFAIIADLTDQF